MVDFAWSNGPHFHRVYLVTKRMSIAVCHSHFPSYVKGAQSNKQTNNVLQTEKHVRIALIKAIAHCSHSRVTQKENLLALPTYYIESRDKSKLHFETFV